MRPRESYLLLGPEALGDLDLLALAVGTGVTGMPPGAIARALVDGVGSVQALAQAPPEALARVDGVGVARAVRLHAGLQLGQRAARQVPGGGEPVLDPAAAARWLVPPLRGLGVEEVHALYLDRRGRPLALRRLSQGTPGFAVLDPGMVLRPALQLGAIQVILAHNHPSGDPEPSAEDLALTRRVEAAGEVVGVRIVDHLVVAGERWTSVRARLGERAA